MKIGFYTYSYIDRLKMEIKPVLEAVSTAGYDGVDISATWRDDLDPALMPAKIRQTYAKTAERLGLEIEAVITHLELIQAVWRAQPLNLKGAVDVACDVGASLVGVHIGRANGQPDKAWRTAANYLREACEYAAAHQKVIMLDGIYIPSIADTAERAVSLIREVDSPAFAHNFDPCYMELSGLSIERALPPLLPHTVHAHIKDYTVTAADFPQRIPRDGVFDQERWFLHRIPGNGVLDHANYVRILHESGFQRYLINECFTDAPFEDALTLGYRTLAGALQECGARLA